MNIKLIKKIISWNPIVNIPNDIGAGLVSYSFATIIQPLLDELESRIPAIDVCPTCATKDSGKNITCCIPVCPVCNTTIEVNVFDPADEDGDLDEKEY